METQHGIASLYTDRRTASGERFSAAAFTAAHRHWPFTVTATERLFEPPTYAFPVNANFGGEMTLLGYDWAVDNPTARLTLIWQANQAPSADYAVFVHLIDANGICCAWQSDQAPQQGTYPTNRWLAGEVVIDEYTIPLADLPPGNYPLELGF